MTQTTRLLTTGFVVDRPGEGSIFPSAGGNSADPNVQAIYWRCIAVLFASARINNPTLSLALFTNGVPPTLDEINLGQLFDSLEVEVRQVPLTARLDQSKTPMWGNVLYFLDILESVAASAQDSQRFALLDSDVVVTAPLDPLFDRLADCDFIGYAVDTTADIPVNGMTPREMAAIATASDGILRDTLTHFGGELFATSIAAWRREGPRFAELFAQAARDNGTAAAIRTEEHLWSIVLAQLGGRVMLGNDILKRIWTSPRYRTAEPGDENLPLWHLPAEKRFGFVDLFRDLARKGFPSAMDPAEFKAMAQARFGLPRPSPKKLLRDGARHFAIRLGRAN